MKINLVSRDNGVGLSTDINLLREAWASHDVAFVEWRSRSMRYCDVAVFLELWNPALPPYARKTVGVFNLEWFQPSWMPALRRVDDLWAKSTEALEVYRRLGTSSARYTGFLGRDLYDETVSKEVRCLHLCGQSRFKGTERVLEAWRRHPYLPPIDIVGDSALANGLNIPPGVTLHPRLPEDELRTVMNRALIHVCPSSMEGWGHYIVEGLSAGAIVITTDASPMREHAPEGAFLLPVVQRIPHGLVTKNDVSPDDIAIAVRRALSFNEVERAAVSMMARHQFLTRNAAFLQVANKALEEVAWT